MMSHFHSLEAQSANLAQFGLFAALCDALF